MENERQISLEQALARTEADAEATLKVAIAVVSSIKKFRLAAKSGDLREVKRTIDASEQSMAALKQQFANAREGWSFDDEAYLLSKDFLAEVVEAAAQLGVKVFEQDDRLYCYPFIVRTLPNERSVLIDKTRERRLRPSVLADHLKVLQNRPIRFKPEALLECLFSAYSVAVKTRGNHKIAAGAVVPLMEIYEILTLLPGQSKEYTKQEFARDIYLLDQSNITQTKKGYCLGLPASTGTKSASRTITVITQHGQEKMYYGISFRSNQ
jgi:hypothetical protein